MSVVKALGMILLAVYIFFSGMFLLTDISVPQMVTSLLGLIGMTSGILILITVAKTGRS